MDVKRITVRVGPGLHERASRLAGERGISLNTLVTEALESFVRQGASDAGRWPLSELAALLAPAADAAGLSEEALECHVREVRRRIWQEQYEIVVRGGRSEVA